MLAGNEQLAGGADEYLGRPVEQSHEVVKPSRQGPGARAARLRLRIGEERELAVASALDPADPAATVLDVESVGA